jgi:LysR family hydrogen peroxide-inducible transcriptional activator
VITLRQLRYLQALGRHRHFGHAAEACAVTQPALSMQIRELEKELDVELVQRRPGEAALTEIGVEVAKRGDGVLAAARDLLDYARHGGRLFKGQLKLGLIPTVAPYLLPKLLPLLHARYPDVAVKLRETQTRLLIEELVAGDLDAVMLTTPAAEADIEVLPMFEDPFLLAVPSDDQHPETARVSAREVDKSRLILLEEGHCLRDQALAFCSTAKFDIPFNLGATSLATILQLVANGCGVTLVPQIAVDAEARDERIKLLRFREPTPSRTIGLAWRRTSPRKEDFVALAQLAVEAVGADGRPRSAQGERRPRAIPFDDAPAARRPARANESARRRLRRGQAQSR